MNQSLADRIESRSLAVKAKFQSQSNSTASQSNEFFARFNESVDQISRKLKSARQMDQELLPGLFDDLIGQVRLLHARVTRASVFLAAYDLQKSQKEAADLEQKIRGWQSRLLPRKPFSFDKVREMEKAKKEAREARMKLEEKTGGDEGKEEQETSYGVSSKRRRLFCDLNGVQLQLEKDEDSTGDISIERASDSVIRADWSCRAVRLRDLERCKVILGPVSGSVILHNCHSCEFYLATGQLRIHSSSDCVFHIVTRSGPIVEDCTRITFDHAYETDCYEQCKSDLQSCKLEMEDETWKDVKDFNWLRSDPSPNIIIRQEEQ